jgi:hypothetical protein
MDEDGCGCLIFFAIIGLVLLFWWGYTASNDVEPAYRAPTTTTVPNQDPTKGWVYDKDQDVSYRCQGPNMIFKGLREDVAAVPDPECRAAASTTTITEYKPR